MTTDERAIVQELANAYRILREAYYHNMHHEVPAINDLQLRVRALLQKPPGEN